MAGSITISTLNNDTGILATQNGMTGIAKAWVNFNGASTPTIRSSFNVSSIINNGTGDYVVSFTTAMPNVNYAFTGTHNGSTQNCNPTVTTLTTSSVAFYTSAGAGAGTGVAFANYNASQVSIAIFSA
jgi:hypothetical protein